MSQPPPVDLREQRPERRKVVIVLPVFNEAAAIGSLLRGIDEAMGEADITYEIVTIDDGSTDDTPHIVREFASMLPIRAQRHEVNLGLGATIRDGLMVAAGITGDRDVIVTMDADDTHMPGLVLRMVRMISEGHDVVIASRYREGSQARGVPLQRRVLSRSASWLLRFLFPIPGVRDYTCGYRAYNASVVRSVIELGGEAFRDLDGFQCMVDILLKLRKMDLVFGEVPFVLRYDRKHGRSKMDVPRTVRNTLLLAAKRKFGA